MAFPSGESFCMASHSPICAHLVSLRDGVFRKKSDNFPEGLGTSVSLRDIVDA